MKKHLLGTFLFAALGVSAAWAQPLELKKGDQIAIVGSALADRQQHHGWLEALIHKAYPGLDLTVRNLGFSADEVNVHPRSDEVPTTEYFLNMKPGTLEEKVGKENVVYHAGADFHANVILAYWGFNESFKGEAGLSDFKKALDEYLKAHLGADYGKGNPRIVLLSPIANEDLKDPTDYPDGSANNKNLELYTKAMAEVAKADNVEFVDLFHPSKELYAQSSHPLTINGIHLTDEGDKVLAPVQFREIFGKTAPSVDDPTVQKIRQAVLDKNKEWHHRYRTVDQYNIYGGRSRIKYPDAKNPKNAPDNATILGEEMAQRDVKTANRDKEVWAIAQGKSYTVVDDDLPPVELTPPNRPEPIPYLDGPDAIKYIKTPEGCKVDFVASEKEFPDLINPVQMNFDTRGRLWVAVWPNYPETAPTTKVFDKLLVFDIDPATGKFTKCTTFADGLNCPTGFQLYKDGVIVMQSPDMLYLRDTDGDGKADWKERLVHGLDAADSHHETNSICYEPGGAVYFSDGVFHRTNVETIHGPVRNANGCIYRFEPRSSRFDRYVPYGFANPHGRVFDYWGNDIITDATGNASYFAPAFSGHLDSGSHPSMKQFWDRPSRPCPGTNILSSRHFPDDWQGEFLNCNVISFQGIYRAKVTEEGSGLHGETLQPALIDGVIKDDNGNGNPNFRPSGVAVAPDGSLYFMDWSQMLIGHLQHHLRDPNRDHQHGRIYRITYPSRPLLKAKPIHGESIENLLELLKEHEDNVRQRAKIELDTRDTKQVMAAVDKWVKGLDKSDKDYEHNRLEALWVHQWQNVVNVDLLNDVLKSPEPRARAQAVRVLCYWQDRVPNALELLNTAIADDAPRVRLEAIRALSFVPAEQAHKATEVAYNLLKKDSDYYLDYTFHETLKQLQSFSNEKTLPSDPAVLAVLLSKMTDGELNSQPSTEPVLFARLERKSYDLPTREKVLADLAKLHHTDRVREIVAALGRMDAKDGSVSAAEAELAKMLATSPAADVAKLRDALTALTTNAKQGITRRAAWAGLIIADGKPDQAWEASGKNGGARQAVVEAAGVIADPALRAQFAPLLTTLLKSGKAEGSLLKAALYALPLTGPQNASANFTLLASYLKEGKERNTVAAAIKQLPRDSWSKEEAGPLAKSLLAYAETVPAKQRTEEDFIELNQLGMDLASLLPGDESTALRKQFRSLSVPVFVVKTVREQLRYDTTRIVVEKGKPFEIIFENSDVMPHNMVIVDPGKHMEIGMAAQTMGPDKKDKQGRQFLPKDAHFHTATKLLEPGEKARLEVKPFGREGEYEYVCTFPGHYMIMWGQIVVTKDVDAYLQAHPTHTLPYVPMPMPAAAAK